MSEKYAIVYNATQYSIELDEEAGIQVLPQEFGVAERYKVRERIQNEELRVVDPAAIGSDSSLGAQRAKEEYERLKKEWEEEKTETATKEPTTNYDDSKSKPGNTGASTAVKRK